MSAEKSPAAGNEQAIVQHFQAMRQEVGQIWTKIGELDMERSEHVLVLNAISPLAADRKCFRLIGGVLVERTVGEVLPAVTRNKEGLEQVIAKLTEQLEAKKKDMAEFQTKYNIRIKGEDGQDQQVASSSKAPQGVLVQ
uniref:Prefoldin subunit 2 n=1 Tax=Pyramimonas obovata TaxID=1411642 RepID=A0A6T7WYZ7_9CHLO|mmetsp:Transcript_30908/g.67519  ORF Transcript_30908/g.67519 Transcript_30908/m.67519 type:complete len:139 (+) Transcript_30908:175-591(+)